MKSFQALKLWLSRVEVHDHRTAKVICRLIPATCPFAKTVKFGDRFALPMLRGRVLFTIPPLCHFNPFYDEFVLLRFRALSWLGDHPGSSLS